jgi:hypothetical protein
MKKDIVYTCQNLTVLLISGDYFYLTTTAVIRSIPVWSPKSFQPQYSQFCIPYCSEIHLSRHKNVARRKETLVSLYILPKQEIQQLSLSKVKPLHHKLYS